jgi:DNA polymerase epsilon subunit 1
MFFKIIKEIQPNILTSFNGDKFDWPYIENRCNKYSINMEQAIGFRNQENTEYYGRLLMHLDCFYWVERDSYLP